MTTAPHRPLRAPAHTLADVLAATCSMLGARPDDLRNRYDSGTAIVRELFVMVAVRTTWATRQQIGAAMGKTYYSVAALERRAKSRGDAKTVFGLTYAELAAEIEREMGEKGE